MSRIRTIKPEFFRHEDLFDAEAQEKLPLRLAFISLWTVADREGRFKWRPRSLKSDCLPFDDIDFARVLDALITHGFIVKYEVDGELYGCIPTFTAHQVVNNREAKSLLPAPNQNNKLTRGPRVNDASTTPLVQDKGEGKGREKEGKESSSLRSDDGAAAPPLPAPADPLVAPKPPVSQPGKHSVDPVRKVLEAVLHPDVATGVIDHRKKLRKPMTEMAAEGLAKQFAATGHPDEAARMMIERGWAGFKVEWFENDRASGQPRAGPPRPPSRNGFHQILDEIENEQFASQIGASEAHVDTDAVRHPETGRGDLIEAGTRQTSGNLFNR